MSARTASLAFALAISCGQALWVPVLRAQDAGESALPPQAAERFGRGVALFDREHYDAALTEFLAAYDAMEGHPRRHQVLYNIAFCYERSFRYDEAIRYYERYLEEAGPGDAREAEVRSVLESLAELLGTVRIRTALGSFEIWVDEYRVGEGVSEVRLPAGTHVVEVRAERHLPARREARVLAGHTTEIALELESVDAFRGLPIEAFAIGTAVTVATLGAGLGVGVASLLEGQALRVRLGEPSGWTVTQEEIAAVQRLSLAADVLYATSALFAVTTIVLAILTRWSGGDASLAASPGSMALRF